MGVSMMAVCAILFGLLPIMWARLPSRGRCREADRRGHDRRNRYFSSFESVDLPGPLLHVAEAVSAKGCERVFCGSALSDRRFERFP
jgi:hypothetical protein